MLCVLHVPESHPSADGWSGTKFSGLKSDRVLATREKLGDAHAIRIPNISMVIGCAHNGVMSVVLVVQL